MIDTSVNKYVHEMDARLALNDSIKKKFKEYGQYVNLNACYIFKNITRSLLKCCFSFNSYGVWDKMINPYKSDKCIHYNESEDWEHVIMCRKLQKERDKFITKWTKEVIHLGKNRRDLESEVLCFVSDIGDYINWKENIFGFQ